MSGEKENESPIGLDEEASRKEASPQLVDSYSVRKKQKTREYIQHAALHWFMFLAGWNDGTTGPLLIRIEEVYDVNYTIVSLIFILACVGFVSGAIINMPLSPKLGFGKMIVLGACCQIVAYAMQAPGPPFPVLLIGYTIGGIGLAIQDAQANGYVASITEGKEAKMGYLHATYGFGALCAPLVATQFAYLPRWSFHYMISLGIAIINLISLVAVFRFKDQEYCLSQIGEAEKEKAETDVEHSEFRKILGNKTVHLLALFILVYVGVEVTIGGWIVTFIIRERHGGKASGYISSGFFGGLMLGRVLLIWVNKKIGERRVLFLYTIMAIGLEVVVWLVPSIIAGGVAVSFVGFVLGPMYPIVMNHTSRILPPWLLTGSIGWIAGFGQAGSALFPFITGAMANSVGIYSLQPLLVAMMAFMAVLWAIVPNRRVTA